MICRLLFIAVLNVFASGVFAQATKALSVPQELKEDAWKVHACLIDGKGEGCLDEFLNDSLWAGQNRQYFDSALNSVDFRKHSTRIDTSYSIGRENGRYECNIAFRDIHYLGGNMFLQFRLNVRYVYLQRENGIQMIYRTLDLGRKRISNQTLWTRKVVWN